jgi:monoamine oxidase
VLAKRIAEVDPANPWAHRDALALDSMSVGDWLRSQDASPAVMRAFELAAVGAGGGSIERCSMLARLRKLAIFDNDESFTMTVVEGSASVPLAMFGQLRDQVRLSSVVTDIEVSPKQSKVTLTDGAVFRADAVVCTIPVGPLRNVNISGLSPQRLASLRRQRESCTSKIVIAYDEPLWQRAGASGHALSERSIGVSWTQGAGILSITIPPERIGHHLTAPPEARKAEVLETLARMWGDDLRNPLAYLQRDWVIDPFTLGYAAWYAPGDLTAIGPLHGTHEPPFFVAGSDHWYAGHMEGAIRTGRAAAVDVAEYLGSC